MKYLVGIIVGLMLLVPAAMGANVLSQTNLADADGSGCAGKITQNEMNAGLSIGSNTVTQTNDQYATTHDKFCVEQNAVNLALAIGEGNVVTQENIAWANGGRTDQDQLNVVAVMGKNSEATQTNNATANELRVGGFYENPIFQNQANLGLIIGEGNTLTQTNDADAVIPKTCLEDPKIIQDQINIAVLINATK